MCLTDTAGPLKVRNFHADPGHGWLEVPVAELRELGIAGQISAYSYLSQDRQTAYLEEDCDAAVYVKALGGMEALKLRDLHTDNQSFIRNLQRYNLA